MADEVNTPTVRRNQITGFNCRICGSSSQSHIDMIKCMEIHKKSTDIECKQCESYFINNDQLKAHVILCHPKEEYDDDDDSD